MPRSMWGVSVAVPVYACLTMFATLASGQLVEDGLIGYWSFDAGRVTGKTVKDGTGNNDAQIMGSVPLVGGIVGDAAEFDGAVENFVSVDNPESFDFNLSFSWSAWINTVDGGSVFAKSEGPGSDGQGPKTLFVSGGVLTFDTGWVDQFGGIATVNDGEWHHVGVTVDIIDGDDPIQFYVDGEIDGFGQMDVNAHPPNDAELVMIGLDGRADLEFPPYTGLIDEVGVYNRVLTEDEMAQNAAATAGLAVDARGKVATTWAGIKAAR
jgi:hypothetical protein